MDDSSESTADGVAQDLFACVITVLMLATVMLMARAATEPGQTTTRLPNDIQNVWTFQYTYDPPRDEEQRYETIPSDGTWNTGVFSYERSGNEFSFKHEWTIGRALRWSRTVVCNIGTRMCEVRDECLSCDFSHAFSAPLEAVLSSPDTHQAFVDWLSPHVIQAQPNLGMIAGSDSPTLLLVGTDTNGNVIVHKTVAAAEDSIQDDTLRTLPVGSRAELKVYGPTGFADLGQRPTGSEGCVRASRTGASWGTCSD